MPASYFDRNQNLQINGDVNFVSGGGSTQDDRSFFHISQRVQAANAQARVIERGFKLICENTSPSARYGSGESFAGPQCHPGTRIAVQDYIFKWLDDPDGQIAMWMNGPVGIGKSAVAQTVANQAAEQGQLSSAFFFFRSDNTRNSAKYLVPTLAYEMTQQMPHTLSPVCQTIGANPLVFFSPLDHQISSALLHPLCAPFESSPRRHMLIIIDGLDECLDTRTQQAIIRSFILSFLHMAEEVIPHKILIVSRPESHIASTMSTAVINPHVKYLALESWDTEDDIQTYLRTELDEIKETHPLKHHLPDVWPDDDSFSSLLARSLGSFAYASITISYLASHNNNPEHALQDLLSLQPNRAAVAFADLDALYRHILLGLDEEMRFILQKVLCLYLYCHTGTIKSLAVRLLEDISTVELVVLRMSSLIQVSESPQGITFHHISFEDFLCDMERSGDLYAFSPNVASAVAHALSSLWLHPLSNVIDYHWFYNISKVMSENHLYQFPGCKLDTVMSICIINALVATRIPASFLYPSSGKWELDDEAFKFYQICDSVASFIRVLLKWRDKLHSNSIHRPLFNNAFDVICAWLRSHFNLFFQNAPTANDVLDIILENGQIKTGVADEKYPFLYILYELRGRELLCCIMRVFPDIDCGEIFSCILERYLALPFNARIRPPLRWDALTAPMLFSFVLNLGGRIPSFCQKLEQIILLGKRALGEVPIPYLTPTDYIFRFFYGDRCYIDSEYQIAVGNRKLSNIVNDPQWFLDGEILHWFTVAGELDRYIRRAHREQDFAYISAGVETLYRTASPMFLEDREREEFWEYYAVKEL